VAIVVGIEIDDLSEGQIVWPIVRDRNGFRKRRPAIVLTPPKTMKGIRQRLQK
jgi:hypothetical protein